MIALEMTLTLMAFFVVAHFFVTLLPIVRKNLLIPFTLIFILFFLIIGRTMGPFDIPDPTISALFAQVQSALGFDPSALLYWSVLFLLWLLIGGVGILIFELFMRDRAEEISRAMENYFSLFGLRNILAIMCFLVPFLVFFAIYYRFMTSELMFLCILCFTSGQLEVVYSSAKRRDARISDQNLFFLVTLSVINVSLLFVALIVLLLKRL